MNYKDYPDDEAFREEAREFRERGQGEEFFHMTEPDPHDDYYDHPYGGIVIALVGALVGTPIFYFGDIIMNGSRMAATTLVVAAVAIMISTLMVTFWSISQGVAKFGGDYWRWQRAKEEIL